MSASESVTSRICAEGVGISAREMPSSKPRFLIRSEVVALEVVVDYLVASLAFLMAFSCDAEFRWSTIPRISEWMVVGLASGLLFVLLLERQGAYRSEAGPLRIRETERVLRATAQIVWPILVFGLLSSKSSWRAALLSCLFVPVLVIPMKLVLHAILLRQCSDEASDFERAVIFGSGGMTRRIVSVLLQSHRLRIVPVAIIDGVDPLLSEPVAEMSYRPGKSVSVLAEPLDTALLHTLRSRLLIVATPNLSEEQIDRAATVAQQAGARIVYLSGAEFESVPPTEKVDLGGLSLESAAESSSGFLSLSVKRCTDLIGSAMLMLFFAPILFLIAILVRLDSPGPALFIQERVGSNGQIFRIFKFRSMHRDSPRYACSPRSARDPRLTRFGRVLRRTSLDELPQLFNILLGNMSLVGPRPEMPFVVESYLPQQRQRLKAMPGLTGLWQLSADRAFPIHEALEYDLYYIRNRGFFLDLAILIHTVFIAMRRGI